MIAAAHSSSAATARAATSRAIGLLLLWILIAGTSLSDLLAGAIAAAIGAYASVVLHPPGAQRISLAPLIGLSLRLLGQSVIAGFDVARRALDPRPLHPGFIQYNSRLPHGSARAAFSTMMSLVPGTLPIGSAIDGTLLIHCLDVAQPVAGSLARDETAFRRILGELAENE